MTSYSAPSRTPQTQDPNSAITAGRPAGSGLQHGSRASDPLRASRLVRPTTAVRESYLAGERADCLADGTPMDRIDQAGSDFDAFVSQMCGTPDPLGCSFPLSSGMSQVSTTSARSVVRHRRRRNWPRRGGIIGYHVVARVAVGRGTEQGCSPPDRWNAHALVLASAESC